MPDVLGEKNNHLRRLAAQLLVTLPESLDDARGVMLHASWLIEMGGAMPSARTEKEKHLKRLAAQVLVMLPENLDDARAVLMHASWLIENFVQPAACPDPTHGSFVGGEPDNGNVVALRSS
jgi:hypothetical protein